MQAPKYVANGIYQSLSVSIIQILYSPKKLSHITMFEEWFPGRVIIRLRIWWKEGQGIFSEPLTSGSGELSLESMIGGRKPATH